MISVTVLGAHETALRLGRTSRALGTSMEWSMVRALKVIYLGLYRQFTGPRTRDAFWGVKSASTDMLLVRTGSARDSLFSGTSVLRAGNALVGSVGSGLKYVKRQEEGGTIHGNPLLRIPTAAAQSPSGAEREEFAGRSLRAVPGVFLWPPSKLKGWASRSLWAVRAVTHGSRAFGTRKGGLEKLYLLVPSVTIPARRMFATVARREQPAVVRILGEGVTLAVRNS